MITLKEIAEKCNLSASSVSRVLNNDPSLSISEDKRILILKTAEEFGYASTKERANPKTTFGLLTGYTSEYDIIDPYYLLIRIGIESYCRENKIELVRIYENEFNKYIENRIDGVIVLGCVNQNAMKRVKSIVKKIVLVDFEDPNTEITSISIDFEQTLKNLFEFFKNNGYKSVGLFAGLDEGQPEDIRTTVYKSLVSEFNFDSGKNYIYENDFSHQGGYIMAEQLITYGKDLPDVIFCENDTIAIGAIKAFYDNNIRVPEDIAIVGFNNIPTAEYCIPPLTTVSIPMKQMGETAAKTLQEYIKDDSMMNMKIFVPSKIIERESTKR
ncbi:LacI family DNA-binding transcriptional regulator [Mollicutes bacterium LVI A0039]|nr:LacI family DNA-binding transcriptional regulator [Mollicutes bacterium LVI A0039]